MLFITLLSFEEKVITFLTPILNLENRLIQIPTRTPHKRFQQRHAPDMPRQRVEYLGFDFIALVSPFRTLLPPSLVCADHQQDGKVRGFDQKGVGSVKVAWREDVRQGLENQECDNVERWLIFH